MKYLLIVLYSLGLLCSGFSNISNAAVDNPTCLCDECTCKKCKCKLCNVSQVKQIAYRPRIIFRGNNSNGGTCANESCNAPQQQQSNLFVVPMPQPPQVNNDAVILPTPNAPKTQQQQQKPKTACINCPGNSSNNSNNNAGPSSYSYSYSHNYSYQQNAGVSNSGVGRTGPLRKFIKKIFHRN